MKMINKNHPPLRRLHISAAVLTAVFLLSGCGWNKPINDVRMQRFDQPALQPVAVQPSSVSVPLLVAPNGRGFLPESLKQLNIMLKDQGRLSAQTLTLIPHSASGEQMAGRLATVLKNAGADAQNVKQMRRSTASGQTGDLEVISEALVVKTTRCTINDPNQLMVKPFDGIGYLGCATQNNLAMMVAEPRDLIQAKALDNADGVAAVNSIERYHKGEVKELIDINFDED
ncbi:CpaD family pilus assembly protein [Pectobacterium parmentieri]|uniref:CpaD family pilus assembly protein n=1 Tax=Pectobacterium parmentieri TaxID=1905730 RepID=UPI00051A19A4|nr:CpaD family pilus assembly protein [Pectobacterium parmentieri]AOR60087.1 pilus assembly protein PilZ [Pectobacterium parmentieri]AYH08935.1 pilus assembly protein PilZ [Pectobacterium parmentieri]AYH20301.1 pilus assembly protein PilZ [Pectobacterium parmentieri]AYH35305.1 pilus assembly protein PilZ [Pectobacterium parmentieri]AZS55371.1 pilus assembly protein PilZ [Pectobacterium parmentieri]